VRNFGVGDGDSRAFGSFFGVSEVRRLLFVYYYYSCIEGLENYCASIIINLLI